MREVSQWRPWFGLICLFNLWKIINIDCLKLQWLTGALCAIRVGYYIHEKYVRVQYLNCIYFLRSEKKVGLKQSVICLKQAEIWALLHKIYFLGLFMNYNWYFIIFCLKTSTSEENNDFLNIPPKKLSKICKKWAIILTLLVFLEKYPCQKVLN